MYVFISLTGKDFVYWNMTMYGTASGATGKGDNALFILFIKLFEVKTIMWFP